MINDKTHFLYTAVIWQSAVIVPPLLSLSRSHHSAHIHTQSVHALALLNLRFQDLTLTCGTSFSPSFIYLFLDFAPSALTHLEMLVMRK